MWNGGDQPLKNALITGLKDLLLPPESVRLPEKGAFETGGGRLHE